MAFFINDLAAFADINPILLAVVLVWSLIWKGLALWKSSQRKSVGWFIILLVVNTVGILEILYIFVFSEIKIDSKNRAKPKKKKAFLN